MSNDAYLSDLPVVTPSQLQSLIEGLEACDSPRPLLVLGPPGVGKTEIIRSAPCFRDRPLRTFYAAYSDRTDLAGYPVPDAEAGLVKILPTDAVLGFLASHDGEGAPVLLFDEVTNAPRDVQSVLLEATRRRTINDRPLPKGTSLIMAGNLHTHGAGSHRLITSLDDRVVRVQLRPDVDDWCRYILTSHTDSEAALDVVALVRMSPELLHDWSATAQTSASPRGWEDCIRILDGLAGAPQAVQSAAVGGIVGVGRAAQLMAMREIRGRIPPVRDIVEHPDTTPQLDVGEPALLAGLVSMLAGAVLRSRDPKVFDASVQYLSRHTNMHTALLVAMCVHSLGPRDSQKVCTGPSYARWVVDHADLLF